MKKYLSLAIVACLLFALVGCGKLDASPLPPNSLSSVEFNDDNLLMMLSEIKSAVNHSQNDDGGYGLISYRYRDLYYTLYCTYTAYDYLSYTDSLTDEDILMLSSLLHVLSNWPYLLNTNTYDDVFQLYYYIKLCKIASFDIPDLLTKSIISFINDMYCDLGLFHRSFREKNDCEGSQACIEGMVKYIATYRSLYILFELDGLDEFRLKHMDSFLLTLNEEFDTLDLSVYDTNTVSLLSHYIRCNSLLGNEMISKREEIQQFLLTCIDLINSNEILVDIYFLYSISFLSSYIIEPFNLSGIINETLKYIDLNNYDNNESFVVERMNLAYEALDRLAANDYIVRKFNKTVHDELIKYKNLDGSFIFNEQRSYPHSTYYATAILKKLENTTSNQSNEYISNEIASINSNSDILKFFNLKTALLIDHDIYFENIIDYISRNREEMLNTLDINILGHHDILEGFIDIINSLGMNLNEQEKNKLLSEYDFIIANDSAILSFTTNDLLSPLVSCYAYYAKELIGFPSSQSEVLNYLNDLIDFTNEYIESTDYNDGAMILLAYYILKLTYNYGLNHLLDLNNVLLYAYQAISNLYFEGFVKFEKEQEPAWEITYYSTVILHYLKTHFV